MPYFIFLGLLLLCGMFSGWASMKVHRAYAQYDSVPNISHYTGYDTAVRLLHRNGVNNIGVNKIKGRLSDHFDPRHNVVNLSEATFNSDSVSAVAVSAHEIGHVMQRERGYIPYKIRDFLVPVVNIGSGLALPVVLVGLILDLFLPTSIGMYCAYTGVVLYGMSTLFHLVTLPVELDASRRAKKMLIKEGIITEEEKKGASAVLSAAALTYVAGLLTSILYFLRFAMWIFLMFRRNNND